MSRLDYMTRNILYITLAVMTSSCATLPPQPRNSEATASTSEEVANLYVAVYPEVPWKDISRALEPKHNLTTKDARDLAATTTQVQVSEFLSTFAAGLGIGLPVNNKTTTTTIGPSGQETTGTLMQGPGTVPAASGQPANPAATVTTPDFAKPAFAPGVDAITLLTAGTSIYQLAQILDNQISKGFLSADKYSAHLVTFQVNLQPKRRALPFDAYVDLSLLPGKWAEAIDASKEAHASSDGLPPVNVYPLIITDAIETANVGRSIEAIRQAALQLSGLVGAVGVNASTGGGTKQFDSFVGLDKNSLVTVGRVSDHTVRIRLGAENAGTTALALVPRTYNVSLVVLTRKGVNTLSAITHSTFIKTDTNTTVPASNTRARKELAIKVAQVVWNYGYQPVETQKDCTFEQDAAKRSELLPENPDSTYDKHYWTVVNTNLEFLRAVGRGDYLTVASCLGLEKEPTVADEQRLRRFLADVVEIQGDTRYSTLLIPLKPYNPRLPDARQLVLYADDQKRATSFVVRGGTGLDPRQVRAELHLKNNITLLPTSMTVTDEGAEISIDFPSLARLGLAGDLEDAPLSLTTADDTKCGADPKPCQASYKIRAVVAEEAPKITNPVQPSASILVADANNSTRLTLRVGSWPKDKSLTSPFYLAVKGANVANDKGSYSSKGVTISENTLVTLALDNLTPASAVTVTTIDSKGTTVGDALVFRVEHGAAAK